MTAHYFGLLPDPTQTCRSSIFEAAIRPINRRDGSGRSIRRCVFGCLSGRFEVGAVREDRMAPVDHRPTATKLASR